MSCHHKPLICKMLECSFSIFSSLLNEFQTSFKCIKFPCCNAACPMHFIHSLSQYIQIPKTIMDRKMHFVYNLSYTTLFRTGLPYSISCRTCSTFTLHIIYQIIYEIRIPSGSFRFLATIICMYVRLRWCMNLFLRLEFIIFECPQMLKAFIRNFSHDTPCYFLWQINQTSRMFHKILILN